MARALTLDSDSCYVLEADRGLAADEQTRWFYRPLSAEAYSAAQDAMVCVEQRVAPKGVRAEKAEQTSTTRVLSGSHEIRVLLSGLTRVENFRDGRGAEITYPADGSRAQKLRFLDHVRPAWRTEIANAIAEAAEFTEAEQGNSASPSGSPAPGAARSAAGPTTSASTAPAA